MRLQAMGQHISTYPSAYERGKAIFYAMSGKIASLT